MTRIEKSLITTKKYLNQGEPFYVLNIIVQKIIEELKFYVHFL